MQNVVGLGGGWAVGTLDDHARLDAAGIGPGNLLFQGRRNQNITLDIPELVVGDGLGLRKAAHAASLRHMFQQGRDVQPGFAEDGAAVVLYGYYARACFGKQLARNTTHVAKTLHGHARFRNVHADMLCCFCADRKHAAAGGFAPAQGAAQIHRFAGDDAGRGGALVHGVGVHHPGHDLLVGIYIGCRNVFVGADDDADLTGVAARDALQFATGQRFRVHANTAFGAAIRHVHRRVLDRHPG